MSAARREIRLASMLFVPASRPRMLAKARTLAASAVILDLEDGVGAGEKRQAREALAADLTSNGWDARSHLFVRVNALASPHFEEDVRAVAPSGALGVCLPKCESADDVRAALAALDRAGAPPTLGLLPFVESARAIVRASEIADADPRVVAVALGSEDLAADMGLRRTREGAELAYYRAVVATTARAAGVEAIDGVFIDLEDAEGLAADARAGRAAGFTGKQIVHPSQIEPVERAFAPTDEERAWAERVVEAFDAAEREGAGVVVVAGEMVDRPVVLRARRLLAR